MTSRTLAVLGLAVGAALALAASAWVMASGGSQWPVLGVDVRMTDPARPLLAGALLVALSLAADRRGQFVRVSAPLAGGVIALALVTIARAAPPMTPGGDLAVIESYTIHALRGELLLGAYSRYAWHHPGPLPFYLFSPFYVLSSFNTSGLIAGAVAMNLLALVIVGWAMLRSGSPSLAVLTLLACLVYSYRASALFQSAWNPHVLVLPTLALIATSARAAAGAPGTLILCAFLGSFVAQSHAGLLPLAVATTGAAVAGSALTASRRGEARRFRRAANTALWVAVLLWALPLAEQVTGAPGNMTRLWQFFDSSKGGTVGLAAGAWGDMIAGLLRPDFEVAMGADYRGGAAWWPPAAAIAQVVALCWAALNAFRKHAAYTAAYDAILVLASVVAFWSVLRIEGTIGDHQIFWITALGALNLAAIAERVLAVVARQVLITDRAAAATCALLAAAVGAIAIGEMRRFNAHARRPGSEEVAVKTLSDGIRGHLIAGAHGKPRVEIDQPAWKVAAGVVLQLQKAGVRFSVGRGAIGMFHPSLAAAGDETLDIVIAGAVNHQRLVHANAEVMTIAERRGFFAAAVPIRGDVRSGR